MDESKLLKRKSDIEESLKELNEKRAKKIKEKEELIKEKEDVTKKMQEESYKAKMEIMEKFRKFRMEAYDDLDAETKAVVSKVREEERKRKGFGTFLILMILLMGSFVFCNNYFDLSLPLSGFWLYFTTSVILISLSCFIVLLLNKPRNKKIHELRNDEKYQKYWRSVTELYQKERVAIAKVSDLQNEATEEIDNKIKAADSLISTYNELIRDNEEDYLEIAEKLFAIENVNTIFIYGYDKYYDYEIYINGLMYSEISPRKLTEIKVDRELTNLRIKANHYATGNSGGKYLESWYEVGTVQIEARKTPVFLMVDNFDIEKVGMQDFFERIKTKKFKKQ